MKCLTIHQPFAHLIITPQSELPVGAIQKKIENRTWSTSHRGQLVIHAGKSLQWLSGKDWPTKDFAGMTFGALVGVVDVIACLRLIEIGHGLYDEEFSWVKTHHHTEGPWCWVLANPKRFEPPVVYRGQQGLFDVPDELIKQ